MVKNYDLGLENQHFQDLGHSFSLYGLPSRQITYMHSIVRDILNCYLLLETRV